MSGKESTGHDLASMIKTNPLIAQSNDEHSKNKHEKESGSPDQSDKTSTKVDAERIQSPTADKQAERPSRSTSPQVSKQHEVSKPRKASSSDDEKKQKKGAQRDSSDEHHRKSSESPKPEMKHDSSQTKHDTTATANTHKNARHSSADSEDLPRSTSKKNQAKQSPRDDEKRSSSRESKKERLNNSKASQKEKPKPKPKPTHSTDDETTDDEHHASKSKKKTTNDEHHKTTDEDTHLNKTHSIQDLVNKSIKPSADPHSDTEQAKPKRRRPKRISRTTQTYEHIFRRMERDQHQDLLPTNDTDKNCQTRKSQLSPQKASSKKSYSIYVSSDDYKTEPVNSKKSSSDQRKPSNTRKSAPESGKLLTLRPTQSDHHSKTISTQRITSEQATNLIRNDKKQDASSADQRAKSKTRKQPEHAQKLPRVNSPASSTEHDHPHKANPKGKTKKNAADDSL